MGNICCGGQDESKKASAFEVNEKHDVVERTNQQTPVAREPETVANDALLPQSPAGGEAAVSLTAAEQEAAEQLLKKSREEQARLDLIVQATGRGMVAVRSTRGSTGYYDQGFAAALSQHLEQTTKFPEHVAIQLPPAASSTETSMYARLSQPEWEGIALGPKDGLAGCAGESPHSYMDHLAEQFLDSVVPKKELFSNVDPIMESLL